MARGARFLKAMPWTYSEEGIALVFRPKCPNVDEAIAVDFTKLMMD